MILKEFIYDELINLLINCTHKSTFHKSTFLTNSIKIIQTLLYNCLSTCFYIYYSLLLINYFSGPCNAIRDRRRLMRFSRLIFVKYNDWQK